MFCPGQGNMLLLVSATFLTVIIASLIVLNQDFYWIGGNWNRNANGQSKGWLQKKQDST